jgi:phosphopantothenoylcysteine decarboxylase / phosphopantothenate---cysteine ligase
MLKGKHIILGVTGSIAAYKAAILVRMLIREGAEVQVVMTPLAKEFITPLTLATLSKNTVLSEFFNTRTGDWHSHVDLGIWADALLIAPATANTMGKMVAGIADNLLITTYLSARCPVFLAPAMDLDMFRHPSTQSNLEILQSRGVSIIEPATGELASGLEGKGRMEEPEMIIGRLREFFDAREKSKKKLSNKKILITAGPTHEPLDPVRFLGNHSSGKMGYALAEAFAENGADVVLVSGPVVLNTQHPSIHLQRVTTASEMLKVCLEYSDTADVMILAAAVADYTPENTSTQKIKHHDESLVLRLKPTSDIAAEIGRRKKSSQVLVGFALETTDELENAKKKLEKKKLDFIVLNSLQDQGAGFGYDTNKITIIDTKGEVSQFELKSKKDVANDILTKVVGYL